MVFEKKHLIFGVLFFVILVSAYTISLTIKQPEECKTNKYCEPKGFLPEDFGKFFICQNGECKTEIPKNLENIICQTSDDCPYGYDCINGECQILNPETNEYQFTSCQTAEDCPEEYECIEGKCWGPE
jgi:hypothetical protein